jgi:hypothetical protein
METWTTLLHGIGHSKFKYQAVFHSSEEGPAIPAACEGKERGNTRQFCTADTFIRDLAAFWIAHCVSNIGEKTSQCGAAQANPPVFSLLPSALRHGEIAFYVPRQRRPSATPTSSRPLSCVIVILRDPPFAFPKDLN